MKNLLILYLNFSDGSRGIQQEVRIRDYFYTPAFVFTAVFIGIGLQFLVRQVELWLKQFNILTSKGPA